MVKSEVSHPSAVSFGANYSPAHQHRNLGLGQDDSVYHKGIDRRPPDFMDELEISDQYIDDFIDASKVKDNARQRFDKRMGILEENQIPTKESATVMGENDIVFVGKRFVSILVR